MKLWMVCLAILSEQSMPEYHGLGFCSKLSELVSNLWQDRSFSLWPRQPNPGSEGTSIFDPTCGDLLLEIESIVEYPLAWTIDVLIEFVDEQNEIRRDGLMMVNQFTCASGE